MRALDVGGHAVTTALPRAPVSQGHPPCVMPYGTIWSGLSGGLKLVMCSGPA